MYIMYICGYICTCVYISVSVCIPCVCSEEVAGLQCMKRILGKVQEMRDQRSSLEKQLRDLIQQDDITSSLVTTDRADMKVNTRAQTHTRARVGYHSPY